MNTRRRFTTAISGFVIIVTTGTVGYMLIEGWSFIDSLYMTIITISTVGFEEVHTLDTAGRAFNIFLIIGGTSVMLYTVTSVVQYLLEGQLVNIWGRRRMKDRISKLKNHVILCGYGLVGREVARVFESESTPFVVIEADTRIVALAAENNYLVVEGNATSDEVLVEAGIYRAKALVAGKTIRDSQQYSQGVSILAVKKKDGILLANPTQDTLLEVEDELVVIGTREQLRGLEGLA